MEGGREAGREEGGSKLRETGLKYNASVFAGTTLLSSVDVIDAVLVVPYLLLTTCGSCCYGRPFVVVVLVIFLILVVMHVVVVVFVFVVVVVAVVVVVVAVVVGLVVVIVVVGMLLLSLSPNLPLKLGLEQSFSVNPTPRAFLFKVKG